MVFQEEKIPPNLPQRQGFKFQLRPFWRRHKLSILIITATLTGFFIGLTLRRFEPDSRTIQLIGFPGKLVIRSFILLIVPLIVCNVTVGISSLGKGNNGRLVGLTISFFFGIALFCAVLGIILAFLIHPGRLSTSLENNSGEQYRSNNDDQILDSVIDLFRNAFPNNLMRATFMNEVTVVKRQPLFEFSNTTEQNATTSTKVVKLQDGVNYIGLLVFSVVFGCAMSSLGDKVALLRQVIVQINAVIMKILQFLLWILIIGMFFWMCEEGLKTSSVTEMFRNIGLYLVTVFSGYAIHHAATLPVTMRTMEEQNKAHPCVTRFVLPPRNDCPHGRRMYRSYNSGSFHLSGNGYSSWSWSLGDFKSYNSVVDGGSTRNSWRSKSCVSIGSSFVCGNQESFLYILTVSY
ncbi:putative sodium-dependent excitatory amino acid transporter glt-3 isoform X5 [Tachypleus tridentatus]|uniref:putative sodium-dependent excitatory amino acid transporter glt-3 isoform X5 n=1 Tax=Tachypleus tridentatus TaxID=6853 RepID=UPI003FD6669E